METATLAGGCFWCTEAIFKRLKGVASVTPGYAGGSDRSDGKLITYDDIHNGNTDHAESIQILFDSSIISYKKLLEVFFHLHDPTTRNQQGHDIGPEYRSIIFYHSEKQKNEAELVKTEVQQSRVYSGTIVTEIIPFTKFYTAENIHQDYYTKNSYAPYCQYVIDPKIHKLLKEFKKEVKEEYQHQ